MSIKSSMSYLKSGDFIIIAVLLAFVVISLAYTRLNSVQGKWAAIIIDGKQIKKVLISDQADFLVEGPAGMSEITISENKIWISKAPCPHKYCQSMGKISRSGESIICVPNRLIVKIEGERSDNIDAITQ